MLWPPSSRLLSSTLAGMVVLGAGAARAQVEITEVMHSPGGSDALWGTG